MRYSIKDEDLNKIVRIEEQASEEIEKLYNEFVDTIVEWGKKFNSELVFSICRKTAGVIDEDYIQAMCLYTSQYSEQGISFVSISQRYYVGEDALSKVKQFQNEILEKVLEHEVKELQLVATGETQYSTELIDEYIEISHDFLSKIESAYDELLAEIQNVQNSNLLGEGIAVLIKYQYETLQKIGMRYERIFEMFSEWYERTLRENKMLLENLNQQMRVSSEVMGEELAEELLNKIVEEGSLGGNSGNTISGTGVLGISNHSSNGDNNSNSTEEQKKEAIKKDILKSVQVSVDLLLEELDTPEKIKDFKTYIEDCENQYKECTQENDKEVKENKFNKFFEFIKTGSKKYGKSIAKALGIVVPLIMPEGNIAGKIAASLPAVIECFTGKENKEKDKEKIEIGLACLKSIGIEKLPENGSEIKKYIEEQSEFIAKDILKKILSSDKYRSMLGIDEKELSSLDNQKLYKELNSESVEEQKKKEVIKKEARKSVQVSVDSILKELDTPEKIKDFKTYIGDCQKQYKECVQETDKETQKTKFQKFFEFVKKSSKKYGKSIAKVLGIVVPIVAPQGHIVCKLATSLPSVIECFTGKENKEKDKVKIELGLECLKAIGVEKLPENGTEMKKYIEEQSETIANEVLKKILSSDEYMSTLGIDEEELSRPDNQKLYKKITGKEVVAVPQKRQAYNYDFEKYDPKALAGIKPIENEEKVKQISHDIENSMAVFRDEKKCQEIITDIGSVRKQINSNKGFVKLEQSSNLKALVDELRKNVNQKIQGEILQSNEGRYNKADMSVLCDEIEFENSHAKRQNIKPDLNRACQNFMRRQLGYPAKYEKESVKEKNELIPLVGKKCSQFTVDNDDLKKQILDAQKFLNSKDSERKKKSVLNSILCGSMGVGSVLGIGMSLFMAALWPLSIVYAVVPACAMLVDEQELAYGSLVSNLGEEKTDTLLKEYKYTGGNSFELVKESVSEKEK